MMNLRCAALMLAIVSPLRAQVHEAPANAPARVAIPSETEPGTRLTVSGRVLGGDDRPLSGASLYVYQTDIKGEYSPGGTGAGGSDRPRLFGFLRSDGRGGYSFSTIRPGSYPNSRNPGHIHFEVVAEGHQPRIYEIVFEGDHFIQPVSGPIVPAVSGTRALAEALAKKGLEFERIVSEHSPRVGTAADLAEAIRQQPAANTGAH